MSGSCKGSIKAQLLNSGTMELYRISIVPLKNPKTKSQDWFGKYSSVHAMNLILLIKHTNSLDETTKNKIRKEIYLKNKNKKTNKIE